MALMKNTVSLKTNFSALHAYTHTREREREQEREGDTKRERDREREKYFYNLYIICIVSYVQFLICCSVSTCKIKGLLHLTSSKEARAGQQQGPTTALSSKYPASARARLLSALTPSEAQFL